jgi:agmatine/peptidylarginine deiminase
MYPTTDYILPAEWAPQSGIQLTWPHAETDWRPYLDDITVTFVGLVRIIARYEKVLIVAQHLDEVRRLLQKEIEPRWFDHLVFCSCRNNDTWARDHAFITLKATSQTAEDRLLDFRFNGWGEKFPAALDDAINEHLYESGKLAGHRIGYPDFVLEGGSIESDGEGTIFTTAGCLLAPHRNQPLDQDAIEERLKQMLYAQRIVWLHHGHLTGDDTDGHIDTLVRVAPNDTLLYIGCDDPNDEQYDDLQDMERELKSLKTAEGQAYRLLRLPMPDALYDGDDRLPATYANFVILNGAVIVPTYHQPAKDKEAMDTIAKAFPDREIIGLDARTVIRQHGSLHCLTMQYPEEIIR